MYIIVKFSKLVIT